MVSCFSKSINEVDDVESEKYDFGVADLRLLNGSALGCVPKNYTLYRRYLRKDRVYDALRD